MSDRARAVRAVALLGGLTGCVAAATLLTLPLATSSWSALTRGPGVPADQRLAALVVLACSAVAACAACWLLLCVLACLVELRGQGSGPRLPHDSSLLRPSVVRRLVRRMVGATLAPALLGPVGLGAAAGAPWVAHAQERPVLPSVLAGLPLPDRTPGAGSAPPRTAGAVERVSPGDSLWAIAASHLPPGSPAVVIDRSWRRLYALNRRAVGGDPDLLQPGTVLRLPPHG